jgi:hypothetical protein
MKEEKIRLIVEIHDEKFKWIIMTMKSTRRRAILWQSALRAYLHHYVANATFLFLDTDENIFCLNFIFEFLAVSKCKMPFHPYIRRSQRRIMQIFFMCPQHSMKMLMRLFFLLYNDDNDDDVGLGCETKEASELLHIKSTCGII